MFGGDGSDGFPIFTIYVRSKVGKVRFFVVYVCVCVCVCVCVAHFHHLCSQETQQGAPAQPTCLDPDAPILRSLALHAQIHNIFQTWCYRILESACHMRRRIHAYHMRRRIHVPNVVLPILESACHMRRRIHAYHMRRCYRMLESACHMRRRIHAYHMRRRIHVPNVVLPYTRVCEGQLS